MFDLNAIGKKSHIHHILSKGGIKLHKLNDDEDKKKHCDK